MNSYKHFSEILIDIVKPNNILLNEPMKNHISFRVGGPCDILVTPEDYNALINVIHSCNENNVPYYIIGNGSNIIVRDKGIRGVVIKTCKLNKVEVIGNRVIAESGALLSVVSKKSAEQCLTGLEFAIGIPGSIGGAITMNAGAYDGEISKVAEKVTVVDKDGNIKELANSELNFGYRKSCIKSCDYIVLKAVFNLKKGNCEEIYNKIADFNERRRRKQPLEYYSAGSTFKRPKGYYAGKLIEDSNLKGVCVGGAQVSEKHSGFIINKGDATARDIIELIKFVQKTVKEKFGVTLETEVKIIGEED